VTKAQPNHWSEPRAVALLGICQRILHSRIPAISAHFREINRYPTNPKTIGEFLRQKRIQEEWTQSQMAEKLGVCLTTIVKWERNVSMPPERLRARIVAYLGFDPEQKSAAPTAG
jgi:DNA-binding XRE family transcriptional regulator